MSNVIGGPQQEHLNQLEMLLARAEKAEAELKHVSHLAAKCRDAMHRAEEERDHWKEQRDAKQRIVAELEAAEAERDQLRAVVAHILHVAHRRFPGTVQAVTSCIELRGLDSAPLIEMGPHRGIDPLKRNG